MNKKHLFAVVLLSLLVAGLQLALAGVIFDVTIDIKPGDDTNVVNLGSNGVVPVAILSTATWDATDPDVGVDPLQVTIAGQQAVAVRGKAEKPLAHQEDVNGDGLTDLVLQIETERLVPGEVPDTVQLVGITRDGNTAIGYDQITIVPPQ